MQVVYQIICFANIFLQSVGCCIHALLTKTEAVNFDEV